MSKLFIVLLILVASSPVDLHNTTSTQFASGGHGAGNGDGKNGPANANSESTKRFISVEIVGGGHGAGNCDGDTGPAKRSISISQYS